MNDGRYVVLLGDSVLLRGWTFIKIDDLATRSPELPVVTVWRFRTREAAQRAIRTYGGEVREGLTVEDLTEPEAREYVEPVQMSFLDLPHA